MGAFARSLDADFRIRPQYRIPLPSSRSSGRDPGLYTSLQEGVVFVYDDGSLGPSTYEDGDVEMDDAVHVSYSGRSYYGWDESENIIYDVTFHGSSQQETYLSRGQFKDRYGEDEATDIGAEINIRYLLSESGPFGSRVNIYAGYGYLQSDLGYSSGLGVIDVYRQTNTKRSGYRYDAVNNPDYAIIDVDAAYGSNYYHVPGDIENPFRAPSKSTKTSKNLKHVTRYVAVGSAELDVGFHEIRLAPEFQFDLNDRLAVGLIVGPTLNVIDGELTSRVSVYRSGQSKPVNQSTARNSETEVAFGAMADLVAIYNVTKSGNVFVEGRLGYHWVKSVDFKAGAASVEVDASSLTGSLAVGWRF